MKIEIMGIKNGFIVKHNLNSTIWEDEVFFKTINQAISYSQRLLEKYRKWQNE